MPAQNLLIRSKIHSLCFNIPVCRFKIGVYQVRALRFLHFPNGVIKLYIHCFNLLMKTLVKFNLKISAFSKELLNWMVCVALLKCFNYFSTHWIPLYCKRRMHPRV